MILLSVILMLIAGVSEAVMDKLQFHFDRSIFSSTSNQQFWNPKISWKNKWYEGDRAKGEKFLGSSTVFVFLTDAWHLFKMFRSLALFLSLFIVGYFLTGFELVVLFIFIRLMFGLSFEVTFRSLER